MRVLPQPYSSPAAVSASVCCTPTEMRVKARAAEPGTRVGAKVWVVGPPPSMPSVASPWQKMPPRMLRAQSCTMFMETSAHCVAPTAA